MRNIGESLFRIIFGLVFTGSGFLVLSLLFTNNHVNINSIVMNCVAGMMFIVAGIWASGILERFVRNPDTIHGLFITFMGLALVSFSILDDPDSFHAPRWIVTAAGLSFALPGLLITVGSLPYTSFLKDALMNLLVSLFLTMFALVAIGVAFSTESNGELNPQTLLCFSPGAVMLTLFAAKSWRDTYKIFKSKFATTDPAQQKQIRIVMGCFFAGIVVFIGLFALAVLVENGVFPLEMPTPMPR